MNSVLRRDRLGRGRYGRPRPHKCGTTNCPGRPIALPGPRWFC